MIRKIKLKDGKSPKDFRIDNGYEFWELTINAIEKLSENDSIDDYTAFILHGGTLAKEKEFTVQRDTIIETIDKSLNSMELLEEYEICNKLIQLKKKFN